jgi:hypothetical protein
MFNNVFKHILTTIVGAFTGLPVFVNGIQHHDNNSIITGIGIFLVGLFSKDHNKQ